MGDGSKLMSLFGRYTLVPTAMRVLGAAAPAPLTLYPNPAERPAAVTLALPAAFVGTGPARATLLNALGQVVGTALLPVQAG